MKYDKLIRDNISEIMKDKGVKHTFHVADETEYSSKLKEKLIEEVNEYLESENLEEIADIQEVIDAICVNKNFDKNELVRIKAEKRTEKGGFDKRIILDETES